MEKIKRLEKSIVTILLFLYFFFGYNVLGRVARHKTIDGTLYLDKIIPLVPFFIIFYLLGYLFVFIPAFMVKRRREFYLLAITYFLIITASFSSFILLQVHLNRHYALEDGILSKITFLQQRLDTKFNTFPSLHVALNLFSLLYIKDKNRKIGKYFLPLIVLIISSTLFVKQHLLIDIMGGIGLAFISYSLYKKTNETTTSQPQQSSQPF